MCNLSALFYGGYGVIMIPSLGIVDAYGGYTPEYHNALGFFVLCTSHTKSHLHNFPWLIFFSMGGVQLLFRLG